MSKRKTNRVLVTTEETFNALRAEVRRYRAWLLYVGGMSDKACEFRQMKQLLRAAYLIRETVVGALKGKPAPRKGEK